MTDGPTSRQGRARTDRGPARALRIAGRVRRRQRRPRCGRIAIQRASSRGSPRRRGVGSQPTHSRGEHAVGVQGRRDGAGGGRERPRPASATPTGASQCIPITSIQPSAQHGQQQLTFPAIAAEHGIRLDDEERVAPCGEPPTDENPEPAVAVTEPWAWRPALQHDHLLTQAQILDDQVRSGFAPRRDRSPRPPDHAEPSRYHSRPAGSLSQGLARRKGWWMRLCALHRFGVVEAINGDLRAMLARLGGPGSRVPAAARSSTSRHPSPSGRMNTGSSTHSLFVFDGFVVRYL